MSPLEDEVLRMVWLFNAGDSRRDDLRDLARRIGETETERDLLLKDPTNRLDGYREQSAKLLAAIQRAEKAEGELAAWKENSDGWQESAEELGVEIGELKAKLDEYGVSGIKVSPTYSELLAQVAALTEALELGHKHLDTFGCAWAEPGDPIIPSQERFFAAYHRAKATLAPKPPPPCWRCSLPDGEHTPECITLQEKEAQTS